MSRGSRNNVRFFGNPESSRAQECRKLHRRRQHRDRVDLFADHSELLANEVLIQGRLRELAGNR